MSSIQDLKQNLYAKFCDTYYTREDLDRDLILARIDIASDSEIQRNLLNNSISGAIDNIGNRTSFRKLVVAKQYQRYVEGVISDNLEKNFSVNLSRQYKSNFKKREAVLLARALAPSLAVSYLPQQAGRFKGMVTGITGVEFSLKVLNNKKYRDTINLLLQTYYTKGYMPALDERLEIKRVALPDSEIPSRLVGKISSGAIIPLNLREVARAIRGIPAPSAIDYISTNYHYDKDSATGIYAKVIEDTHSVAILKGDDGKSVVPPVITSKKFAASYFWQFIYNDRKKREGGARILSIPHSWARGKEIGELLGLGAFGKRRNELGFYSSAYLERILKDSTQDTLGVLYGFVDKKKYINIRDSQGTGFFTRKSNPLLYPEGIRGFTEATLDKIFRENLNKEDTTLLTNAADARYRNMKFYKKPFAFWKISGPKNIKDITWKGLSKKRKKRFITIIDLVAAAVGTVSLVVHAIIAAGEAYVDTKLLPVAARGNIAKALLGRAEAGSLTDRMMLSFDSFKFSFNAIKLIFKDGISAGIPALLITIISGNPVVGIIAGGGLFAVKFSGDFLSLFSTQNPAVVNIIDKITGSMVEGSLSFGEVATRSIAFGGEFGLLAGMAGYFLGFNVGIVMAGAFVGGAAIKALSSITIGRGMDVMEASRLDVSASRLLLFKSQYLTEFGVGGAGVSTVLFFLTGGNPLVFVFTGAGLISGAVADYFKNAIYDEAVLKTPLEAERAVDLVHVVGGFGGGMAIIGGALFGPIGAIALGATGAISSGAFSLIQRRMQSITVGDKVGIDNLRGLSAERIIKDFAGKNVDEIKTLLKTKYGFTDRSINMLGNDAKIRDLFDSSKYNPDFHPDIHGRGMVYEKYVRGELSEAMNSDFAIKQQFLKDNVVKFRDIFSDKFSPIEFKGYDLETAKAFLRGSGFSEEMILQIERDGVFEKISSGAIADRDIASTLDSVRRTILERDWGLGRNTVESFYKGNNLDWLKAKIKSYNPELGARIKVTSILSKGNVFDFVPPSFIATKNLDSEDKTFSERSTLYLSKNTFLKSSYLSLLKSVIFRSSLKNSESVLFPASRPFSLKKFSNSLSRSKSNLDSKKISPITISRPSDANVLAKAEPNNAEMPSFIQPNMVVRNP